MIRGVSISLAVMALVLLTACGSPGVGEPFDPDATTVVPVGQSDNPPAVASGVLDPGESIYYQVNISSNVAAQGDVLYYDVDIGADAEQNSAQAFSLRLYNQYGGVIASSTTFAGYTSGLGAEQLSIGIPWFCFGPCILERALAGTVFVRIENVSGFSQPYDFYSYVLELQDLGEPENDSQSTAVPIDAPSGGGTPQESGAIELIGDVDFYRVAETGDLTFFSNADSRLGLRAQVYDLSGSLADTLSPGETRPVFAGEIVRVFSSTGWAGSPQASRYSFEIQ